MFEGLPKNETAKKSQAAERHDQLLNVIDAKVQNMMHLHKTMMQHMEAAPEDFASVLRSEIQTIVSKATPEQRAALVRSKEIEAKLDATRDIEDDELFAKAIDDSEVIEKELREIKQDHEVFFLMRLSEWVESMCEKREQVDRAQDLYEHDQESFRQQVLVPTGMQDPDISKMVVEFSGIHINCFLPADEYRRVVGDTSIGSHYSKTPVNLIMSDHKDSGLIKQHEQNHNLYESFTPPSRYHERLITSIESQIRIIRIAEKYKAQLKTMIERYGWQLQSEMTADLDNMFQGDLNGFFHHFLRSYKALNNFAQTRAGEYKSLIEEAITYLEDSVIRLLNKLKVLVAVAIREGKEAEMKAAFLLLGPTKIQHLEAYMRRFSPLLELDAFFYSVIPGEEFFDFEDAAGGKWALILAKKESAYMKRFIDRIDVDPLSVWSFQQLDRVLELVGENAELGAAHFSESDKDIIFDRILYIEWSGLTRAQPDLLKPGVFAQYLQRWKQLGDALGMPELGGYVHEKSLYHYVIDVCALAVNKSDYSSLQDLLTSDSIDRKLVESHIHQYLYQGFFQEDYETDQDIDFESIPEAVRETPFGQWLKDQGVSLK